MPPERRKAIQLTLLTLAVCCSIVLGTGAYIWKTKKFLWGKRLNHWAWEASYTEREWEVPFFGPREGYWGYRLGAPMKDPVFGQRTPQTYIPNLVDVRSHGLQYVRSRSPSAKRILIVGGSVAWGAYASTIPHTYFNHLARGLETIGQPAEIVVSSDGGWTSAQELAALEEYERLYPRPNVVVALNGLNDIHLSAFNGEVPTELPRALALFEDKAEKYLERMRTISTRYSYSQRKVIFVLQPALFEKKQLSALESRSLELSVPKHWLPAMREKYERMREGLSELAKQQNVYFVDASRCFDDESATTFTDLWHFSDRGHQLLADAILPTVTEALKQSVPRQTSYQVK